MNLLKEGKIWKVPFCQISKYFTLYFDSSAQIIDLIFLRYFFPPYWMMWYKRTVSRSPLINRAERYDFWPRLWLFFSPFLFPPKKRGKNKRRMNRKNRDQKSCLSVHSFQSQAFFPFFPSKFSFEIFSEFKTQGHLARDNLQIWFFKLDSWSSGASVFFLEKREINTFTNFPCEAFQCEISLCR